MQKSIAYLKIMCYNNRILQSDRKETDTMAVFSPGYYYDNVTMIPASLFKELGIRAVVLDIDNTLVTYDDPKPTPTAAAFLKMLNDSILKSELTDAEYDSTVKKELEPIEKA